MISSNQVKVLLRRFYSFKQFHRNTHNVNSPTKVLHPLSSRGLIKLSGEDSSVFLQGLITNDMKHLDNGYQSIYAMFLNNKGRILYDTLIHKWDKTHSFIIECDSKVINFLLKHLQMFKLRRNLQLENVSTNFNLWAITESLIPNIENTDNISFYKDPRLSELGLRIIASKAVKGIQVADHFGNNISIENNEDNYRYLRYKLGVSEGADDLLPSTCFPLEANCDYLHGVSFHKGCYIGQEVTARVHHTGVVRKRIMPLKFVDTAPINIKHNSAIVAADNPKSNVGKFKGVIQNYGIGLLRIKEALDAQTLKINDCYAESFKPTWWPLEAPKEITKSNETN